MGNTVLFVVDASGSMGAQQRMTAVKGAILSLLIDAYQKRDRVGLVVFRGKGAEVLLPPTSSVELARKYMQQLPVGGKDPACPRTLQGIRGPQAGTDDQPSYDPEDDPDLRREGKREHGFRLAA